MQFMSICFNVCNIASLNMYLLILNRLFVCPRALPVACVYKAYLLCCSVLGPWAFLLPAIFESAQKPRFFRICVCIGMDSRVTDFLTKNDLSQYVSMFERKYSLTVYISRSFTDKVYEIRENDIGYVSRKILNFRKWYCIWGARSVDSRLHRHFNAAPWTSSTIFQSSWKTVSGVQKTISLGWR